MMSQNHELPILSAEEVRVLGALMEKSRTTPEYYPMTLNSLTAACNQKTSRKPVVNYDDNTIMTTLDLLKKRGLVSTVTGGTSRVTKFKHNISVLYPLMPSEWTILALLMLRGPLTPGEINNSSGRMFEFDSLDEVNEILDKLSQTGPENEPPFVTSLTKKPGQKEVRFAHLFSGSDFQFDDDAVDVNDLNRSNLSSYGELEARLAQVEMEFAKLREEFDLLMKQLT